MLASKLSYHSLLAVLVTAALLMPFTGRTQCDSDNGGFSIGIDTIATNIGQITGPLGDTNLTGFNTYRLYIECESADDLLQAVAGTNVNPTSLTTTTQFFQQTLLGGYSESTYNPLLFGGYPDLEYDSFLSIGLTAPALAANGEVATQKAEDSQVQPISIGFESGNNLIIDTFEGATWFVPNADEASNSVAGEDLRIFFAQLTTDGDIDGQVYFQMYRNGIQEDSTCVNPYLDVTPLTSGGCTDETACNFDAAAYVDDGSCIYCTCADTTVNEMVSFPNDTMPEYSLEIEVFADHDTTGIPELAGLKTYRFYIKTPGPCLLYTSPSPRDLSTSRMPSSA